MDGPGARQSSKKWSRADCPGARQSSRRGEGHSGRTQGAGHESESHWGPQEAGHKGWQEGGDGTALEDGQEGHDGQEGADGTAPEAGQDPVLAGQEPESTGQA